MNADPKVITDNHKADYNIVKETRHDVESVLDLDRTWNGKFKFCHCGLCDGSILGNRTEKFRNLDSETYDAALVRRFENKVRNIEGFRVIVKKHIQREQKEELEEDSNTRAKDLAEKMKSKSGDSANNIADTVKTALATIE